MRDRKIMIVQFLAVAIGSGIWIFTEYPEVMVYMILLIIYAEIMIRE